MSDVLSQGPIFLACLIFMLGFVVVVHELGHYLAGRLFGAAAESFSVGFGRPIFERMDKRGTRWRLNWIPLGGFVKFVGENQTAGDVGRVEEGPIGKRYMEMGVGARSVIAAAGPFANFVLAAIIFAVIALSFGTPLQRVTVGQVQDGPAKSAGLEVGDAILTVNDVPMRNAAQLVNKVALSTGDTLRLGIERAGVAQTLEVVPVRKEKLNDVGQTIRVGTIGVGLGVETYEVRRYGPISALGVGVARTGETLSMTMNMLARMATGKEPLNQLNGPVGIGDFTRRAVNATLGVENVPLLQRLSAMGWTLVQICALVSVGIGFFNLLPLPVLDGGHLVFNAYEAITGKVLPEKIQEISLNFGLVLLLGMAVFVTWGDIIEIGVFGAASS